MLHPRSVLPAQLRICSHRGQDLSFLYRGILCGVGYFAGADPVTVAIIAPDNLVHGLHVLWYVEVVAEPLFDKSPSLV